MSRNRLDERRTEHRSVKLGVNPARRSGRARWMFPLVAVTMIVLALAIWVAGIGNIIRKDASLSSGEQSLKLSSTPAVTGESGVSATAGQWHRRPLLNLSSLIRRLVKQDLLADHGVRYANRLHPVVSQEPGFPRVLFHIGRQLLAEKRLKRATAQFRKLVELNSCHFGHFSDLELYRAGKFE